MTTSFTNDSSKLAASYDRISDPQFEGGQRLVERLALHAGDRVLDVGCGTGRLARWIAERVVPGGSVVGVDPLPERIAIARQHAGSAPVTFETGQAEDLGAFAAESFDAVSMSAMFHWIEDRAMALREVRRVLRPGGRVGVTTLVRELMHAGTASHVISSVFAAAPYASRVDLSGFALASRGLTTTEHVALLLEAGLELVELHIMPRERAHASGEEVVDFMEASSFGNFLRIVPEDDRATFRGDLAVAFEAHRGPDGIVMRDWGMLFVARRPPS
jgi:ubiquinone/menaquinone biosynthesis C-methylase UbiE